MEPTFFDTPAEFRAWLEENHENASELIVGFHRVASGLKSITWPESVDEALCFGWIDGLRRGLDDKSYTIRFTPRKVSSTWSAINLKKMEELIASGRMTPAGLSIWEKRKRDSPRHGYTYDGPEHELGRTEQEEFQSHDAAWAFFEAQAPSYRKQACHWVMSPKREETRKKRLAELVRDSASGKRLGYTTKYKA